MIDFEFSPLNLCEPHQLFRIVIELLFFHSIPDGILQLLLTL